MASFWSEYLKNKILDHMRGVTAYAAPATTYFALMVAPPTPLGGGTEVTAHPRLSYGNTSAQWNAATGGVTTNKTDMVFFATAAADLGEVVGIAEYDASSGGNLLSYGDLTVPKTILTGMSFTVAAGNGQFTYIDDTIAAP